MIFLDIQKSLFLEFINDCSLNSCRPFYVWSQYPAMIVPEQTDTQTRKTYGQTDCYIFKYNTDNLHVSCTFSRVSSVNRGDLNSSSKKNTVLVL